MFVLYISSSSNVSITELAEKLHKQEVECMITQNFSVTPELIETGFEIKLFNLEKENFKEKVWDLLQPLMDLKCAHVIFRDEYRGCVLNWPGIFDKNNCKWDQNKLEV